MEPERHFVARSIRGQQINQIVHVYVVLNTPWKKGSIFILQLLNYTMRKEANIMNLLKPEDI